MKQFDRAEGAFWTTALLMPACMLCARWSVWRVLTGGVPALIILYCMSYLAGRAPEGFELPRWFGALRVFWCAVVLGYLAALTRGLFPQSDGSAVVPAVLLLLAALACAKGEAVPARVGAVLWPFVLAMLAVVLVFALPDLKPARLLEPGEIGQSACALALLLLPGLRPVRRGKTAMPPLLLLALVVALVPAVICTGLLGTAQVQALQLPMYASAQSISVFGVMERFEVLLSGALAASGFCAMCLTISAGADALPWTNSLGRHVKALALAAAGFGLMVLAPQLAEWVLVVGNTVFCGLLPLGILAVAAWKKVEKNAQKTVDKPDSI